MVALVIFALNQNRFGWGVNQDPALDYTRLINEIDNNNVQSVKVAKDVITGKFNAKPLDRQSNEFTVNLPDPPEAKSKLIDLLTQHKVPTEFVHPFIGEFAQGILFSIMLPLALVAAFWIIFIRQAQSGGNQA